MLQDMLLGIDSLMTSPHLLLGVCRAPVISHRQNEPDSHFRSLIQYIVQGLEGSFVIFACKCISPVLAKFVLLQESKKAMKESDNTSSSILS